MLQQSHMQNVVNLQCCVLLEVRAARSDSPQIGDWFKADNSPFCDGVCVGSAFTGRASTLAEILTLPTIWCNIGGGLQSESRHPQIDLERLIRKYLLTCRTCRVSKIMMCQSCWLYGAATILHALIVGHVPGCRASRQPRACLNGCDMFFRLHLMQVHYCLYPRAHLRSSAGEGSLANPALRHARHTMECAVWPLRMQVHILLR